MIDNVRRPTEKLSELIIAGEAAEDREVGGPFDQVQVGQTGEIRMLPLTAKLIFLSAAARTLVYLSTPISSYRVRWANQRMSPGVYSG